MKKGLALFDFDGTITQRDTFLEFIKFQKGIPHFYFGMFFLSPVLVLYKLKIIRNSLAKEVVLKFFFRGDSLLSFQSACDRFIQLVLPSLLRKGVLDKIAQHLAQGDRVVVVSASPANWIEGWCRQMKIELISTELEIKMGVVTGRLKTLNCYGIEKVNRIKSVIELSSYDPIYAYGDTEGDKPMLALAQFQFYQKF